MANKRVELIGINISFDGPSLAVKGKVQGVVTEPGEIDLTLTLDVGFNHHHITEREAIALALKGVIIHYLDPTNEIIKGGE